MRILGVDPGTLILGIGIIELKNGIPELIHSEVVNLKKIGLLQEKLLVINNTLRELIRKYHVDEISVETAFYGKNVQSALKIGYARGAALLAAAQLKIPVAEYSPREIKKSVTGSGAASKEQVSFMVKTALAEKSLHLKTDESDAIAVALCHCNRFRSFSGKKSDWKAFIKNNPGRVIG